MTSRSLAITSARQRKSTVFEAVDTDLEDCSEDLAKLPLITFDTAKHFIKHPTYKQEIRYLLQCLGSPHIVQLLGRTQEGALVFPKLEQSFMITVMSNTDHGRIQNIRRWMLDVVDGVAIFTHLGSCTGTLSCGTSLSQIRLSSVISHIMPLVTADLLRSMMAIIASFLSPAMSLLSAHCCGSAASTIALTIVMYSLTILLLPSMTSLWPAHEKPEDRPTLAQLRTMYEAIGSDIPKVCLHGSLPTQ